MEMHHGVYVRALRRGAGYVPSVSEWKHGTWVQSQIASSYRSDNPADAVARGIEIMRPHARAHGLPLVAIES